jgi:hypothetical protein
MEKTTGSGKNGRARLKQRWYLTDENSGTDLTPWEVGAPVDLTLMLPFALGVLATAIALVGRRRGDLRYLVVTLLLLAETILFWPSPVTLMMVAGVTLGVFLVWLVIKPAVPGRLYPG